MGEDNPTGYVSFDFGAMNGDWLRSEAEVPVPLA
jgi:hypothetical protein